MIANWIAFFLYECQLSKKKTKKSFLKEIFYSVFAANLQVIILVFQYALFMLDFVYFMMTVKDPSKEEDMFTLVAVIGIYWEIFVVFQLSVIVYLFFAFFGKEEKYVE